MVDPLVRLVAMVGAKQKVALEKHKRRTGESHGEQTREALELLFAQRKLEKKK